MNFIAKTINCLFKMLVCTWIFIYAIFTRTAAEERPAISKLNYTGKKDLNLKHDGSTIQPLALKARNKSNKLTFQTLYPQFMSTWSSVKLNEKQRQVTQVTVEQQERRRYLSTKKMYGPDKPTTIRIDSVHNAFTGVETMRPYVPKRVTTSKKISKSPLSELRYPIKRSGQFTTKQFKPNKEIRNLSAQVSILQKTATHLNMKLETSSDFLKDLIKRNRMLTSVPTSYPLQKMNLVKHTGPQRRKDNSTLLTDKKKVLNRLKQLESDLKKFRTIVNNGTDVINYLKTEVQEKDNKLTDFKIKKKNSSLTVTSSVKNAKTEAKSIKVVDNIKVKTNSVSKIKQNSIKYKTKLEDTHDFSKNRRNMGIDRKQAVNKVNQLRMEWLKQKLSGQTDSTNKAVNYRKNYKDFDHIKNRKEEKEYKFSFDVFNKTREKKHDFMTNKSQTIIDKKGFDNGNLTETRNVHYITRDPLAYDSLDLQLEHESNIREYSKLKDENSIAVKPTPTKIMFGNRRNNVRRIVTIQAVTRTKKSSTKTNEEAETDFSSSYNDNGRSDSLVFAPKPGYNKRNLNSNKNKNIDQEVVDDVLKKIRKVASNRPKIKRKPLTLDGAEALGKKMLGRLNLPGLNSSLDDTIPNNKLNNFDHVKYVESVMTQTSLPLYERRNIIMKSLDQRINEMLKKYNFKPKQFTKDDLDTVLKSMGATLHK